MDNFLVPAFTSVTPLTWVAESPFGTFERLPSTPFPAELVDRIDSAGEPETWIEKGFSYSYFKHWEWEVVSKFMRAELESLIFRKRDGVITTEIVAHIEDGGVTEFKMKQKSKNVTFDNWVDEYVWRNSFRIKPETFTEFWHDGKVKILSFVKQRWINSHLQLNLTGEVFKDGQDEWWFTTYIHWLFLENGSIAQSGEDLSETSKTIFDFRYHSGHREGDAPRETTPAVPEVKPTFYIVSWDQHIEVHLENTLVCSFETTPHLPDDIAELFWIPNQRNVVEVTGSVQVQVGKLGTSRE